MSQERLQVARLGAQAGQPSYGLFGPLLGGRPNEATTTSATLCAGRRKCCGAPAQRFQMLRACCRLGTTFKVGAALPGLIQEVPAARRRASQPQAAIVAAVLRRSPGCRVSMDARPNQAHPHRKSGWRSRKGAMRPGCCGVVNQSSRASWWTPGRTWLRWQLIARLTGKVPSGTRLEPAGLLGRPS